MTQSVPNESADAKAGNDELETPFATDPEPSEVLWGNARVTAYCSCELCCGEWAKNRPIDPDTGEQIVIGAAGRELHAGVSVAAPSSIPLGTEIRIDGLNLPQDTYVVDDRLASWAVEKFDGCVIDIYFDSHEACWDWVRDADTEAYYDIYIEEVN